MTAIYCSLKAAHNWGRDYSPKKYARVSDRVGHLLSRVLSPEALHTASKIIYLMIDLLPKLALIAIPTAFLLYQGFKIDNLSPAFVAAATWMLLEMLKTFYPYDVLTDLNQAYRQGKLPAVIPDVKLTTNMTTLLGAGLSVLLRGDTGTGKSAAIRALVGLMESDSCPPSLKGKKIVALNLEEMLKDSQNFLTNLVAVLKTVRLAPGTILYIDEIHRLEQKIHGIRISDILKLYFEKDGSQGKRQYIQTIGITTPDKFKEMDSAFTSRFHLLSTGSAAPDQIQQIIEQRFEGSPFKPDRRAILRATGHSKMAHPAGTLKVIEATIALKVTQTPVTEEDIEAAKAAGLF